MSEDNQDKKEQEKDKEKDKEFRDLDPKKDPKGGFGPGGPGTGGLGPPAQ